MAESFGQWLAELGWIDRTALAVVLVFSVLGLIRGMVWQVGRVLTLVGAYVVAAGFGTRLGGLITSWLPEGAAPELGLYAAWFVIFLAVLIVLSVLSGAVHRALQDSPLSFANRVGGALCGVATGALVVLALLTGVQMAHGATGLGAGVAEAASCSESRRLGDDVLAGTGRLLPDSWATVAEDWRMLLRGDEDVAESAAVDEDRVELDAGPQTRVPAAGRR